jgi:tetratricopeptide (TPR) repeat protein
MSSRHEADRRVEAAFQRHKQGDLAFAQRVYRETLARFPDHAPSLHYLGLLAQQGNRPREAVELLQRSIAIEAGDPRAHNHLGQVWIGLGERDAAVACFERALAVDPHHADSVNNLANAIRQRDPQRAQALYRLALQIDPRSANAAYNLANHLQGDEAIALLDRAIELDPRHYRAHQNLAVLFEQRGRFDEAVLHYEAVRAINPRHAAALANLLSIRSYHPNADAVRDAEALVELASTTDEERIKLHNGLGKYYDRRRRYDQAFGHFVRSKEIVKRHAGFDVERTRRQFDRIIATFSSGWFDAAKGRGHATPKPVFIVGMPRSGTTLTEQILASHPAVFGAGELQAMPRVAKAASNDFEALAAQYLRELEMHAPHAAQRVTDKLPVNFVHLGWIATLFPNARIVHCRRDPLDIGLSCLIELFAMENDFTTDLESFGQFYGEYERLMAHWRQVLPITMHEQRYEDLVADPETHARALIAYCDLEWDAACLEFQRADRAVQTPSRWQVRQPIYATSVGRWKNYAPHLELLRKNLRSRD